MNTKDRRKHIRHSLNKTEAFRILSDAGSHVYAVRDISGSGVYVHLSSRDKLPTPRQEVTIVPVRLPDGVMKSSRWPMFTGKITRVDWAGRQGRGFAVELDASNNTWKNLVAAFRNEYIQQVSRRLMEEFFGRR